MTKEEILVHYTRELHQAAVELHASATWREKLTHYKECRLLVRHLDSVLDHVENKVRLDCHDQTGLRTIEGLWMRYGGPRSRNSENP